MPAKKPMIREGISTRPTDEYGNRATNADLGIGPGADAKRKAAAMRIMAQEGTTSAAGGRAPAKMPMKMAPKIAPAKMPVKVAPKIAPAKMPTRQPVTRTTVNMKPSPTTKRK